MFFLKKVNGHDLKTGLDFYKANSSNINNTTFRLDPAVTDLDMSPEETLSEPPSVRTSDINDLNRGMTYFTLFCFQKSCFNIKV